MPEIPLKDTNNILETLLENLELKLISLSIDKDEKLHAKIDYDKYLKDSTNDIKNCSTLTYYYILRKLLESSISYFINDNIDYITS